MGSGFPPFGRSISLNPYKAVHRSLTKALVTDVACVLSYLVNLKNHQAVANSRAMSRDAKTVASWDFHRIIPCHGVYCSDYAMYSVSDPHVE
jgi:hypothetical protein